MDTTANIADVDTGRTVQRVPPFVVPSANPLRSSGTAVQGFESLTVRSKKKKRMKPWIERRRTGERVERRRREEKRAKE